MIIMIEKYKENPMVKDLFENTLLKVAETSKSGRFINYLLLILEYQLNQEKNNKSPFKINSSLILDKLRNNIVSNYTIFNRATTKYPDGFISVFQKHDSILQDNYGHKIL